jgi:molybdopterin synthase sulfur carrier subunit
MVTVFVPTMLQPLTGGVRQVDVPARNVRQLVDQLDQLFPGMKDRLVDDGQIRSNLAVSIDGEISRLGLMERLDEASEVHFVPAIGGGNSSHIT